MRSLLNTLAAGAALCVLCAATAPTAQAGSVGVSINLNGYLPAPPGVHIYYDSGRPYYVENHQRVYLKKGKEHHDNGKKKGHKKHHKD
ncbi:hypothetical protein M1B72_14080 [Geomonas paludis]|nr:hypothetical protein [Geomonas paludis]UPU34573.1 hypothetical protein M1B72_14080 [Geomonas paludis]